MTWKATIPNVKIPDGQSYVVVSIKRSSGARMEVAGFFSGEHADQILRTARDDADQDGKKPPGDE